MTKDRQGRVPFAPDLASRLPQHERTAEAARLITQGETETRAEKTARLRAIRLGQDSGAETPPGPPASGED